MKRFILLISSLIYLSTSTGANLHLHYCMGKMAGWDLFQKDQKECSKCGMKTEGMNDGCCKDEYQYVKLKVDQKIVNFSVPDFSFCSLPDDTDNTGYRLIQIKKKSLAPLNNSALRRWSVPLYVRNRLFLI